jgi:hypothetical protein
MNAPSGENQTVRKAKEEYRYETVEGRKPTIGLEDKELFSEHGRILDNVCYRSHWFVLVKAEYGGFFLLVKHGAGEERISLGFSKKYQTMMQQMDSDTRYYMMHALMQAWHDGEKKGRNEATAVYRTAFAEGRLKKRKLPNQSKIKVWIEES